MRPKHKSAVALITACASGLGLTSAASADIRSGVGITLNPAYSAEVSSPASLRFDLSAAATNTDLARTVASPPGKSLGVSLSGSAFRLAADNKNRTGAPKKSAIYGHNVDDVVIGNMSGKKTSGKKPPKKQGVIIYNGTITSEPTNTRR
jgi:hypothetical protein